MNYDQIHREQEAWCYLNMCIGSCMTLIGAGLLLALEVTTIGWMTYAIVHIVATVYALGAWAARRNELRSATRQPYPPQARVH